VASSLSHRGTALGFRFTPGGPGRARLFSGLEPPPGGWRAAVRAKDTLPQYPMVLHRGGYPGGS
jgi:hypothetical protein